MAAAGGEVGLEGLHVLLRLGGEEAADLGGAEGGGEAEELVHRDVRSQGPAGCWGLLMVGPPGWSDGEGGRGGDQKCGVVLQKKSLVDSQMQK